MSSPHVRRASVADLPALTAILNDAIADGMSLWLESPLDLANRRAWLDERERLGQPVIVYDFDGAVAGFASYGPFRPQTGFRETVEDSVYVAARFQRRGIARALLTELISLAWSAGVHVVVAAIDSSNTASIDLHAALGFVTTGSMPQVGIKFGSRRDLTLMQLINPQHRVPEA